MKHAPNLWPRAIVLALALHLGLIGGGLAAGLFVPASAQDFGAQDAIEFAPLVASAESEFLPDAAENDAEDRQATPKLEETLSKKTDLDIPTEQASPQEAEKDLRMAEERTQKTTETPKEQQQATEEMKQQEAQTSSSASTAAEVSPDQSGKEQEVASAPELGQSLEARRRMEAWQKKLFAHIVKFRRYPAEARGRRLTGEAQVAFALDAQGGLRSLKVSRGSGHRVLDAAAQDWMMRASPLPAPPPEAVGREFTLPMKFSVQ